MNSAVTVELTTTLTQEMLAVVTGFAEQAGKAFGLAKDQQHKLVLAMEELFVFLTRQDEGNHTVRLVCRNGGYYIELACLFPMNVLPAAVFNITAKVRPDDDASLEEMGLMLAARAVDRLEVMRENRESLEVRLIVEKEYPKDMEVPLMDEKNGYVIRDAGKELLKQFSQRVAGVYGKEAPVFFAFPGKVVDMVASGEYDAVLAVNEKNCVGGGMFWRQTGKMVEFFGPYIFTEQERLAEAITDQALEKMARTQAFCMVALQPTREVPRGYFESLGKITLAVGEGKDSAESVQEVLYRELEEDQGATVYTHPEIIDFMRKCYGELVLPRSVVQVNYAGEIIPEHSAFSVALDWHRKQAFLSVLAVGRDADVNLKEHVTFLQKEGIKNLFFYLDVGSSEEALLTPALADAGFVPRLVLPWGGRGDLVLFEYGEVV